MTPAVAWRPRRPLSFVHLTTFYPPYAFGGDAVYVSRLAGALADEGHSVDVVHCVDAYHLLHPAPPPLASDERPDVRRHGIETGFGRLSPLVTHQFGRPGLKRQQLAAVLSSRRFDVAHFHNISLIGPSALALPIAGDPVRLYMAHEYWLVCPMHVLFKFDRMPCDAPACLRCTIAGGRPPQAWRYTGLLERASRSVDRFLAPTTFAVEMHRRRGFPAPFHELPLFVERVDAEWQRPAPRPQAEPYCLLVSRLEKVKGVHDVVQAWTHVSGCDLLVVGEGRYGLELRAMAASNPRVRFLGARTGQELGPLYVHALATIVTSATYETFGLTILESLARRTPVVVRAIGALDEVAASSGGALSWSTADELAAAVAYLQREPDSRRRLGIRGYEAYLVRWTREAHLERYFGHLREAALQRHGRVPWDEAT